VAATGRGPARSSCLTTTLGAVILRNGTIRTLDPSLPAVSSLWIAAEWIAGGVGVHETSLPSPETVDLGGRCVLPGFTDSHVHFPTWAVAQHEVKLDGCSSLAEALERIRAAAAPGEWRIDDLEGLVAQRGEEFPDRVDEWRYYVHFLREHADADGAGGEPRLRPHPVGLMHPVALAGDQAGGALTAVGRVHAQQLLTGKRQDAVVMHCGAARLRVVIDGAAQRDHGRSDVQGREPAEAARSAKPRRNLLFSSTSRREREREQARTSEPSATDLDSGSSASAAPGEASEMPGASFEHTWPKLDRPRRGDPTPPRRSGRSASTFAEPAAGRAEAESHAPSGQSDSQPPVTVLKSGVVDGMAYSLYSDGSIEAQMPEGMMRFASIDELRAHLDQRP